MEAIKADSVSHPPVAPKSAPKTAPAKAAWAMHIPIKGILIPTMKFPRSPQVAPDVSPQRTAGSQKTMNNSKSVILF